MNSFVPNQSGSDLNQSVWIPMKGYIRFVSIPYLFNERVVSKTEFVVILLIYQIRELSEYIF